MLADWLSSNRPDYMKEFRRIGEQHDTSVRSRLVASDEDRPNARALDAEESLLIGAQVYLCRVVRESRTPPSREEPRCHFQLLHVPTGEVLTLTGGDADQEDRLLEGVFEGGKPAKDEASMPMLRSRPANSANRSRT
jgi:hypothetical protein